MTTITYSSLLESRLNYRKGKARGYEWAAMKMPKTPLVQQTHGVPETISKIIALGLKLELEVGQWVAEVTKSELNISDVAKELLLSNVGDEVVHYKAFSYAAEDYMLDKHLLEADAIFKEWNTDDIHPIHKACYSERGVFLVSLAVMRIFGGESLSMLAGNVSRDEFRHVATNSGVLADIGHDFHEVYPINRLVDDTLDWMLSDLTVNGLDKDFFIEQSHELISNGYAPELDDLTNMGEDISSFESPNYLLY